MSEQVMVIVGDVDDPKHGEINIVESVQKGARLVETLLEAGFDQSRLRVFSGAEMDMRVRHRPVVALVSGDQDDGREADSSEVPSKDSDDSHDSTKRAAPASTRADAAAEHYERNGVRFSTAFRPA